MADGDFPELGKAFKKYYRKAIEMLREINVEWLFQNKFVRLTLEPITAEFGICENEDGERMAFVGNVNKEGLPAGFVRCVNLYGNIYIGNFGPK